MKVDLHFIKMERKIAKEDMYFLLDCYCCCYQPTVIATKS